MFVRFVKIVVLLLVVLFHIDFDLNAANFIVADDGSGNFKNVQAAIDACKDGERNYIFIKNGTYYGQTTIGSKANASTKQISLIGESRDGVILTYDKSMPAVATFEETCTFQVYAKNFYAENITFVNTAGNTGQALALYTAGDMAILKNCSLIGYQDTYRSKKGTRAYLLNCWIEGAVDFIYAGGTLVFDDCTINCIRSGGFITAPEDAYATVPKASTTAGIFIRLGFIFRNCTIQGPASVAANSFYLGRPWGDYAGTAYLNCKMSNQVHSSGWATMGSTTYLTSCFAEYNSMDLNGNPIDVSKRVSWSYQLPQADVETHLTPAAIYAKSYTSTFEPLGLSVSPDAPTDVKIVDGKTLQWTPVSGAGMNLIYFNNRFVGISSTPEFDVSGLSGIFQLRALSNLGVLSNFSSPITEVPSLRHESIPYSVTNGILSFESEISKVEIFDAAGRKLKLIYKSSVLDLRKYSNSVLIIRITDNAGEVNQVKLKI
jgi:pectin methylesterase-like acyl-CoA thioesterase